MTYTQLKADIADYLHRTDLTDKIPGFIRLAEAALLREFSPKETEISVSVTSVDHFIDIPADFNQLCRITTAWGAEWRTLEYHEFRLETGKLWLKDDATVNLYYIPKITPLSDSVDTNWMLSNAPDLYLYASALEGAKWMRDAEQISMLTGMVGGLLDAVRRLELRKFITTGSLQIKPRH